MRAYLAAACGGARRAFGDPGELAVRAGFYAVLVVVFVALWGAAARGAGGALRGYDHAAPVWYVIAAEGAVTAMKPRENAWTQGASNEAPNSSHGEASARSPSSR